MLLPALHLALSLLPPSFFVFLGIGGRRGEREKKGKEERGILVQRALA